MKFMKLTFKKNRTLIMSVIAAITMITTAYITKGSEYENAFLYIFIVWSFLFAVFEGHDNYKKNKGKDL